MRRAKKAVNVQSPTSNASPGTTYNDKDRRKVKSSNKSKDWGVETQDPSSLTVGSASTCTVSNHQARRISEEQCEEDVGHALKNYTDHEERVAQVGQAGIGTSSARLKSTGHDLNEKRQDI